MRTKKQVELLESFLQNIPWEDRQAYQDLAQSLSELGYHSRKLTIPDIAAAA